MAKNILTLMVILILISNYAKSQVDPEIADFNKALGRAKGIEFTRTLTQPEMRTWDFEEYFDCIDYNYERQAAVDSSKVFFITDDGKQVSAIYFADSVIFNAKGKRIYMNLRIDVFEPRNGTTAHGGYFLGECFNTGTAVVFVYRSKSFIYVIFPYIYGDLSHEYEKQNLILDA